MLHIDNRCPQMWKKFNVAFPDFNDIFIGLVTNHNNVQHLRFVKRLRKS